MTSSGTPAGWYPDPENPGQSRYWDGASWAAPTGTPVATAAPGGGSGGGKTVMIVIAVLLVLGLVGGGVWALTSGDGDDDVATDDEEDEDEDEDDDDDDDDGIEELGEAEFRALADSICTDLEDELDSTADDFFAEFDFDDLDDLDPDLLAEWRDSMLDVTDEYFPELRAIAPEGDVDGWLDLVEEWEDVYHDLIETLAEGDFELGGDLEDRYDDVEDAVEGFGLECLGGSSMTDGASSPGRDSEGTGDEDEAGPPSAPPAFDDSDLVPLGEECYEGDMDACTDLYIKSGFGTPEEEYGESCGGRTDPDDFVYCPGIEDPILP